MQKDCTSGFNKILLTGGTGRLGSELLSLRKDIYAPSKEECNILNKNQLYKVFDQYGPDLIIHAAAYTDVKSAETDLISCLHNNVLGTLNVLEYCIKKQIKMVYISTDAVFDGDKGWYETGEPVNPISVYAKSKTAAELIVRAYKNSLIIRTSFYGKTFPYEAAFIDQWSTKDYIDVMAPKILKASISQEYGVTHVGSLRRSIYDLASMRKPDVRPMRLKDYNISFKMPKDLSLKE